MLISFVPDSLRIMVGKNGAVTLRSDDPIEVTDTDSADPTVAEQTSDDQFTVRLSKRQSEAFGRLSDDAIIAAWAEGSLTLPNAVRGPGVKRGASLSDFLSARNAAPVAETSAEDQDENTDGAQEAPAEGSENSEVPEGKGK